jgi:hypothetical protein
LSGTASSLIDVALDVPLPIYGAVTTRSAASMAPFSSRLLLVLVAALCISLLRRTVLPRLAQTVAAWFPTLTQWMGWSKQQPGNTAAIVETTSITSRTVVPPLETYIPTSVLRREVTAVVTKPSAPALELDDYDDEEDEEEVEDDEWDVEDDNDHDDEIELSDDAKGKTIGRVEEEDEAADNTIDASTIDTTASTAMLFEDEGWGQARLVAKEQVADSTLIKLSFALPRTTDYLPLAVGDKVRLCVVAGSSPPLVREDETDGDEIDDDDDADGTPLVAKVYPFGDASSGQFSFLVEDPSLMEDNADDDEEAAASARLLVRTILDEFQTGDELAIQPALPPDAAGLERIAPWQISENNIHTIMYWANGSGISPALDHVRIILDDEYDDNNGKENNGVQNAKLLWVNNAVGDFTYAENDLDEQYERHGDRLAIACVAEDAPSAADDIAAALVPYTPGVLAVLSGPRSYTADAARFLMDSQGYPEAAICVL